MDAKPKVQVKHVLNTIQGLQDWLGHVHAALRSLDPEQELDVKSGPLLKNGSRRVQGVCPPPENGPPHGG